MHRRMFIAALGATACPLSLLAQHDHGDLYERLDHAGRVGAPPLAASQDRFDSPAPQAPDRGRWESLTPLPLPRSEMAWAAAYADRIHIVGGYAEQRVDRAYHQVYDVRTREWTSAAALPRGANHVGVAFVGERLYAVGGFIEQNRRPHDQCFVYDIASDRWREIARLPGVDGSGASGAIGCAAFDGRLHAVGGAIGDTNETKKSIDRHLVYDADADRWTTRAPLPTGRDHLGIVAVGDRLHVIGGRVDAFNTNSDLHHVYDDATDRWEQRRPMPTPRSGHGSVLYRDRIFVMGGEGTNRVFGQLEGYDPATDAWLQYEPMPTPRHGMGAAVAGDAIHVAGGGPLNGGSYQSAVHEAFALG